ncbi:unnamed protein product [Phytophthora fragariaefolia]|uniref:Unnamed protein product n=1 Tax=Phytophthora fragariaefolia TaxID=1490495 RepID=A0A9W6YM58_9STRA|nr:unnamed protein product [Phytophthora fragariaefolia]
MWRIGRQMKINREAITLTRTTPTSMTVTPRPPMTLSVELRQSGRTAGLKTAAVEETSLTEGSTVTPATKARTDVAVSIVRVRHAEELTTLPTCYKRCKLCKQVHDASKFEAFQTMSTYLRTKVDKKDLPVELQSLLFSGDLN